MHRSATTLALVCALAAPAAEAQSTLERTPNLSGGRVATPGSLFLTFPQRFAREAERGLVASPTYEAALALPRHLLAGGRFAPHSSVAAIRPGERWQARFDRPGRYPFHCGPHPFMRGMVVVR